MKRAGVLVIGLVLSLAVADRSMAQSPAGGSKLPKGVEDVLWWLPEDTQTVIVAQGPFKANAVDFERRGDSHGLGYGIALMGIPGNPLDPALTKRLRDRTVLLALEGSRRYRWPTHLGMMPFEGAQILVFQDDLGADGKALMDSVSQRATKTETIAGVLVVLREEKFEGDLWSLYHALPKPNILIIATNRAYIQAVLDRMKKRAWSRALPASLPEWKQFDPTAKVWAIRHFDPKDAAADPTSPLSGQKGVTEPDDQARGLVFWIDPREGGSAKVKYLSNNKDAVRIAQKSLPHIKDAVKKTIALKETGVVVLSIPLKTLVEQQDGYFLFYLQWALGHGICL